MKVNKWGPFAGMSLFRREMDRLVERFFGGESGGSSPASISPDVDVIETDDTVVVKAELPGIDERDVSVTLSGENLVIRGEKKQEKDEKQAKGARFHRVERSYGVFQRTVSLPSAVEAEKVAATFDKGVLQVTLPKRESAQSKEIKIKLK